MIPALEQTIKAEIERLTKAGRAKLSSDNPLNRTAGLFDLGKAEFGEWVLSLAKSQKAAPGDNDEKIVKAMCDVCATVPLGPGYQRRWMVAALAVARQHLVPQAVAKALDELQAKGNAAIAKALADDQNRKCLTSGAFFTTRISPRKLSFSVTLPENLALKGLSEVDAANIETFVHRIIEKEIADALLALKAT